MFVGQRRVIYCTQLSILHITYTHNTTPNSLTSMFLGVNSVGFGCRYNCISIGRHLIAPCREDATRNLILLHLMRMDLTTQHFISVQNLDLA